MDFLLKILEYSIVYLPLLTMALLLLWIPANMKNTSKAQFIGIFTLFILIVVLCAIDYIGTGLILFLLFIVLLTLWIFVNRGSFQIRHISIIFLIFIMQFALYLIFLQSWGIMTSIILCSIITIISLILLYSWIFGNKKALNGRLLALIIFIV